MLGDHDDFHRDYSNPLPRTDQRTSPIAATCGHADCAESPELARACTIAERFAMPDPDGISAMRDALEAENCYCVDRGSCAEIYTLR